MSFWKKKKIILHSFFSKSPKKPANLAICVSYETTNEQFAQILCVLSIATTYSLYSPPKNWRALYHPLSDLPGQLLSFCLFVFQLPYGVTAQPSRSGESRLIFPNEIVKSDHEGTYACLAQNSYGYDEVQAVVYVEGSTFLDLFKHPWWFHFKRQCVVVITT